VFVGSLAASAFAQDYPKAEVFGGYQFRNAGNIGSFWQLQQQVALEPEVGVYHEHLSDGGGPANVYCCLASCGSASGRGRRGQLFLRGLPSFDHTMEPTLS
jgi:hypothetical protein